MNLIRAIILVVCFGISISANSMILGESSSPVNPLNSVRYLEDSSGFLTIEDIRKDKYQKEFKSLTTLGEDINFGYSNSTYWLRLPLAKTQKASEFWVLELPYFALNQINFYAPGRPLIETGSSRLISSRPIFYRFYAFPITLTDQEQYFYFQVRSSQPISVPLRVWDRNAFIAHAEIDTVFQAMYYGGIGALAIFNLFLFIYLRDKAYILYAIFASFIALGIFSGNGYGRLLLWPHFPVWDEISQSVFLGIASSGAMSFVAEFLKVSMFSIRIYRALYAFAILLLASSVGLIISTVFSQPNPIFFISLPVLVLPSSGLAIYAGYRAWKYGHKGAKFFLLAWGILIVGGLVACLRMFDFIPSNPITSYALQISSAVEMLVIAFALASRIQEERELREKAQLEALHSKENLVKTLQASEERLENQVSMRTNDLRMMLISEKRLREQYIRFGSMISHEFRNPLGIIETQIALLARDGIGGLPMKRVSVIGSACHRLALLFDRWLQGDRLENSIDQTRPQAIEINEWLGSLVDRCRIYHSSHEFNFKGLPKARILVADEKMLEAVVLNLIDNACKFSSQNSAVTIKLIASDEKMGISVADRGIGIAVNDQLSIFEEYLQLGSKVDAKGFGLGLAFVKKIVEFHGGEIELISEVGVGSEFIAWFPNRVSSEG